MNPLALLLAGQRPIFGVANYFSKYNRATQSEKFRVPEKISLQGLALSLLESAGVW
jgi:hypothetical protein